MTSWLALVGLLAPCARAHNPYEGWASARLRADRLELGLTLAQSTALRLIDPEMKARALTVENFAEHRARLESAAAAFFILTAARKPVPPRKVAVEITDENDVVFTLHYPLPAPGRLHFHAAFLKKLGDGYACILEVNDLAGDNLGWDQLMFENPNLEVPIPAPKKP